MPPTLVPFPSELNLPPPPAPPRPPPCENANNHIQKQSATEPEEIDASRSPTPTHDLGQTVFTLRRRGSIMAEAVPAYGTEAVEEPPANLRVRAGRRKLLVGRELLHRNHVSKTHAKFYLQKALEGDGWILMMSDCSSNGTWLNSQKLNPGQLVQIRPGDLVSFLPPSEEDPDLDPLTYELVSGSVASATRRERKLLAQRRKTELITIDDDTASDRDQKRHMLKMPGPGRREGTWSSAGLSDAGTPAVSGGSILGASPRKKNEASGRREDCGEARNRRGVDRDWQMASFA